MLEDRQRGRTSRGSSALSSNRKIIEVLHEAMERTALPKDALQLIEDPNRSSVDEMLKLNGLLDVIIPRGGSSLIQNVVLNATVPVIETGAGICHTYIDASAEQDMAVAISLNAKVRRPSVCNSMETLLVHADYAKSHLTVLAEAFRERNVESRGCQRTLDYVPWAKATPEDYATEYNDYILNIKIVDHLDEAIEHISIYGTKHSECIVAEDKDHARFLQEVDAVQFIITLRPVSPMALNLASAPKSGSAPRSRMQEDPWDYPRLLLPNMLLSVVVKYANKSFI